MSAPYWEANLLFDTVKETVRERVGMFPPDDVRIEPSQLGDQAGVWGGIALARDPSVVDQSGTE